VLRDVAGLDEFVGARFEGLAEAAIGRRRHSARFGFGRAAP
jgi:hypothetical protein